MARNIYSTRFIAATLNTATPASSYVVPAGKVAVISFVNFDAITGPVTARLNVITLPGSVARRLVGWLAVPTDTIVWWNGRAVVNAGETIQASNGTLGSTFLSCFVSGYLLTA